MLRIAISSIITAATLYSIHAASATTPYITIVMLLASGVAAGALTMFAVLNDSEGAK